MIEHLGVKNSFWWLVNIGEAAWYERKNRKQKSEGGSRENQVGL
jgi:hypothetical protein